MYCWMNPMECLSNLRATSKISNRVYPVRNKSCHLQQMNFMKCLSKPEAPFKFSNGVYWTFPSLFSFR
jgi:hypothetical protein